MFGIGLPEMILILALALIVVGPDKLPDLARSVARGLLELKKTAETLKDNITDNQLIDDIRPDFQDASDSLRGHFNEAFEDHEHEGGTPNAANSLINDLPKQEEESDTQSPNPSEDEASLAEKADHADEPAPTDTHEVTDQDHSETPDQHRQS